MQAFSLSLAASTLGQLQGTGLASKAYDFRLRFWDRFLGSFLNASSSKVTSLRAALRAEFLEPQKLHILGTTNVGPNHLNHLLGCFVLPSL